MKGNRKDHLDQSDVARGGHFKEYTTSYWSARVNGRTVKTGVYCFDVLQFTGKKQKPKLNSDICIAYLLNSLKETCIAWEQFNKLNIQAGNENGNLSNK